MHRGRNTLILLALGLAMAAYVYFVEMKRTPASEANETRPKLFGATLDATTIDELTLKSSTGERTSLKKTNNAWAITAPIQSPVDESEVSSITSNLATLESSRTVDEEPKDLAPYGLAEPRLELQFKTAADKQPRTLLVGGKTPTGGDLYAKLADDKKVVLIPAYLDSTFDRSTFQLRDKTILKFDRDKVDTLEIAAGPTTMTFAKEGEQWMLTQPYRAKTDSSAVEALIGRLASSQMKSLAVQDPAPAALAEYGLAKPEVKVTIGAGSARTTMTIGKAAAASAIAGAGGAAATPPVPGMPPGLSGAANPESTGDGAYARDESRPMVFTIEKSLADDLKKGPADYRQKDLFEFREFTGTKVEVSRSGTPATAPIVFEKTKQPAGKDAAGKDMPPTEQWTQAQPAKTVEADTVRDFATKIGNLRADTFVDKLPAGAAEMMTVTTTFEEGKKTEKVVLYKAGADYFAVRAGDPGAAKLPLTSSEELVTALDAVK